METTHSNASEMEKKMEHAMETILLTTISRDPKT